MAVFWKFSGIVSGLSAIALYFSYIIFHFLSESEAGFYLISADLWWPTASFLSIPLVMAASHFGSIPKNLSGILVSLLLILLLLSNRTITYMSPNSEIVGHFSVIEDSNYIFSESDSSTCYSIEINGLMILSKGKAQKLFLGLPYLNFSKENIDRALPFEKCR